MAFKDNVFINCPFDAQFLDLLRPLLFTVVYLKLVPRIALEAMDSGKVRIEKIVEMRRRRLRRAVHVRLLARLGDCIRHNVRDLLLRRPRGQRKLLIVALPPLGIRQYAAGMIDEAQRFFDVTVPIACLRVVLPDEATERGPDVFVR